MHLVKLISQGIFVLYRTTVMVNKDEYKWLAVPHWLAAKVTGYIGSFHFLD